MSRSKSNTNAPTFYCKVCQDAGKPETVYRSHFIRETRDPTSRITCPTLLALECRFCFKKGHTVKCCKTLKEKDQAKSAPRPAAPRPAAPRPAAPQTINSFACLDSESDEEQEIVIPVANSYASVLAKPIPIPITPSKLAPWMSQNTETKDIKATVPPPIRRPMTSWADDTDSEDEEDLIPAKHGASYNNDW